jgi:Zn-dependent peptidase ImmA (M78 family)
LRSAISLRELQAHAAHCHLLMQLAKARCRPELHSAQDEEDLRAWSKAKEEAQAALLAARRTLHKDEELTMGGEWTEEVLNRTASHFDVSAQAVRRRMGGGRNA